MPAQAFRVLAAPLALLLALAPSAQVSPKVGGRQGPPEPKVRGVDVTFLINNGFFLESGEYSVLIDGFVRESVGVYPALLLRAMPGAPGKCWDAGDSGSVWFDAFSGGAIGLHVGNATGETTDYAVATQLTYICEQLDLDWV